MAEVASPGRPGMTAEQQQRIEASRKRAKEKLAAGKKLKCSDRAQAPFQGPGTPVGVGSDSERGRIAGTTTVEASSSGSDSVAAGNQSESPVKSKGV